MVILVTCYKSDAFLRPTIESWVWLPGTWNGWQVSAMTITALYWQYFGHPDL